MRNCVSAVVVAIAIATVASAQTSNATRVRAAVDSVAMPVRVLPARTQ